MFVASKLWSAERMRSKATMCVFMHNVIVETQRGSYSDYGGRGLSAHYDEVNDDTDLSMVPMTGSHEERLAQMEDTLAGIESPGEQKHLILALRDKLWCRMGLKLWTREARRRKSGQHLN